MKHAAVQLDEVAAKCEPVFLGGGGEAGFGQHGSEAGRPPGHIHPRAIGGFDQGKGGNSSGLMWGANTWRSRIRSEAGF